MGREIDNGYVKMAVEKDVVLVRVKDGTVLDLRAAQSIAGARMRLQGSRVLPVCVMLDGVAGSDKAGRDFLAKFGWAFAARVAVVATAPYARLMADFYLRVHRPVAPHVVVAREADAVAFLVRNDGMDG